jgi:hypothetical protein
MTSQHGWSYSQWTKQYWIQDLAYCYQMGKTLPTLHSKWDQRCPIDIRMEQCMRTRESLMCCKRETPDRFFIVVSIPFFNARCGERWWWCCPAKDVCRYHNKGHPEVEGTVWMWHLQVYARREKWEPKYELSIYVYELPPELASHRRSAFQLRNGEVVCSLLPWGWLQ